MMPSVFSLEDLSDSFWPPSPSPEINHAESHWSFDHCLVDMPPSPAETAVTSRPVASQSSTSKIDDADDGLAEIRKPNQKPLVHPSGTAPIDTQQYHAFLKNQLDLACAAVALTRASSGMVGSSAVISPNQTVASNASLSESSAVIPPNQIDAKGAAPAFSKAPSEPSGEPVGLPALPARQKKAGVQGRKTTSESSRDDSDDEELEGGNEVTENMDPAESKRARRMLSNRESARRSRRRKQEQMNELETQVSQLKVENSTLLNRLNDINRKCDDASVDNRILKADIETLRAKVRMAEETVKRVTGMNPLLLAMTKASGSSMPYVNSTVVDASKSSMIQVQQNFSQLPRSPLPSVPPVAPLHERRENGFTNNSAGHLMGKSFNDAVRNRIADMNPMQHMVNLEHLQSRIRHDDNSSGTATVWNPDLSHILAKNK